MRSRWLLAGTVALALGSTPAGGQTPTPAPPASDLQSRFNAASEAFSANQCEAAVPQFASLLVLPAVRPGGLAHAAASVRLGLCLVRLGRSEEGEIRLNRGLPRLEQADATFAAEIAEAHETLGLLAFQRWDHDLAITHLNAALNRRTGNARLLALMKLAQVTAFDSDDTGLQAAREGLSIVTADPATGSSATSRAAAAPWHTMIGRILLNRGQTAEGLAAMRAAYLASGGEKDRVSLPEALLRADLAQAHLLAGHRTEAYRFMAASGAGRVQSSPFAVAREMDPPTCGPETGLEPQDSAVVEFSILPDGQVGSAQPVFSRGGYAKAAAFARAVRGWQWAAEDVARLPDFYRLASRVELQCTRAEGLGGADPLTPLMARFMAWGMPALGPLAPSGSDRVAWPQWLKAAEAAAASGNVAGELAARTLLAARDLRGSGEIAANLARANALAADPALPPEARNAARVLLAGAGLRLQPATTRRASDRLGQPAMIRLADDPAIANDPLASNSARLMALPWRLGAGDIDGQAARVANDTRLGEHHPLRQYAALRLANAAAQAGDLATAQRWFATTGLNEEQCALIGPRPALDSARGNAFPWDALAYGFEGWVKLEFDLAADGQAQGVRPVIAYPPFVFTDAGVKTLQRARYEASFRPTGGLACSANTERVRFTIPDNNSGVTLVPARRKPSR